MSFVPQITCRQCGTKFSGLRGRCPKCGAPRNQQPARPEPAAGANPNAPPARSGAAHTPPSSTARWQLIFGGILVVAVIIAVIILVAASLNSADREEVVETPDLVDVSTPPPTTPPPTDTPEPTIAVTSITILTHYNGQQAPENFTQRTSWAPVDLDADVYPKEALTTATVQWRSSNEDVCTVDQDGIVTAVGPGSCEIIAECGGLAARCSVLVP